MAEPEEVLREVTRIVLGLPPEAKGSLSSLKKDLEALPLNLKERPATPSILDKQPLRGPLQEQMPRKVAVGEPAPNQEDLPRRLREYQNRFKKKADEAEKLKVKLQQAERALKEAESAKAKALQEAAHWRKKLSQVKEERDRLSKELATVGEEKRRLQTEKEALKEQLETLVGRVAELEARLGELEGIAEQKEDLEAQLARLSSFKETLPEPFPQEALLRVLVLEYPSFGGKAEERVMALIEGYQALLKGEDHPALRHSNRELLRGEAEGIVLVGLEKLLEDLVNLPLARWLRVHAFRLEALLQEGQRLSLPRLTEE